MMYGYQGQAQQGPPQQSQFKTPSYQNYGGAGAGANISEYRSRLKSLGLEDSVVDKMLGSAGDFMSEMNDYKPKAALTKGISSMANGGTFMEGAASSGFGSLLSSL